MSSLALIWMKKKAMAVTIAAALTFLCVATGVSAEEVAEAFFLAVKPKENRNLRGAKDVHWVTKDHALVQGKAAPTGGGTIMDAGFLELSKEASTPAATVCATCSLQSAAKVDGAANAGQPKTVPNPVGGETGDEMESTRAPEAPEVELTDEQTLRKAEELVVLHDVYADPASSIKEDCSLNSNQKGLGLGTWLEVLLYAGEWKNGEEDGTAPFSKATDTNGSEKLSAFGGCIEEDRLKQYKILESRARPVGGSADVSRPLERGEELLKKLTIMVANDMSGDRSIAQCVASNGSEDGDFSADYLGSRLGNFRASHVKLVDFNPDPLDLINEFCDSNGKLLTTMAQLWQILDLQRELRTAKGVLNSRFAGSFPDEAKVDLSKESITNLFIDKEVLKHLVEELEKMKAPLAEGTGSS